MPRRSLRDAIIGTIILVGLSAGPTSHRAVVAEETPDRSRDAAKCPLPGDWKVYEPLTDEFDGSQLDSAKWWPRNPKWRGRKPGLFRESNVEVRDGMLHLTARAEDVPDAPEGYERFTTAAVQAKQTVLYGYFECRARPMDSRASSAFWLYHNEPTWWTEIDIFEIGGGAPEHERVYHMNVHVFRTPEEGNDHWSDPGRWEAPYRLADEFRVYGLEWTPEVIRWYVDGTVVRTRKNTHWHQPLFMNFDSETMPNWFGLPKESNLPSTFSIDYLRTWKRAE